MTLVRRPGSALPPTTARIRLLSAANSRQVTGKEQGKGPTGKRNRAPRRHPSSRDAAPSAAGVEFGSAAGVTLGRLALPGWRPRQPRLGYLGGQTEVPPDALHQRRLLDQRDEPQRPAAAGHARTSSPNVRRINSAPHTHPPGMTWRHSCRRPSRPFAMLPTSTPRDVAGTSAARRAWAQNAVAARTGASSDHTSGASPSSALPATLRRSSSRATRRAIRTTTCATSSRGSSQISERSGKIESTGVPVGNHAGPIDYFDPAAARVVCDVGWTWRSSDRRGHSSGTAR
jgi:hypothetical protein